MGFDLKTLAGAFRLLGDFVSAEEYGSGHINDTFAVTYLQAGAPVRYILQRVSHVAFKNPPELMENVERVTQHLAEKLDEAGADEVSRRALSLVPTQEGASFHRDKDGNYWRTYLFIEKARTYDLIESTDQAAEAAKAFGVFQNMLTDLPGPRLHETIRDFHNTRRRFEALQAAIDADAHNRAATARPEIEFAQGMAGVAGLLLDLQAAGEIPERITHNDTKLNNVMIDDATSEGICVIDLDTVMPGLALYDFGDMVRTACNAVPEDERDLSSISVRMPMFGALVHGYLSTAGEFLNEKEKELLPFAGRLMTLETGFRFLTDYLAGDVYFKVHRDGHNLERCRAQFKLSQVLEQHEDEMNACVEEMEEGSKVESQK